MNLEKRLAIAAQLDRTGTVHINNGKGKPKDIVVICNSKIYVDSQFPIVHPFEGYKLDNPMTWDTFTHIYLLGKPD